MNAVPFKITPRDTEILMAVVKMFDKNLVHAAEMKIVGCDLHARQQTIAVLDTETGGLTERTLEHQGDAVREFWLDTAKSTRGVAGATSSCHQ